MLDLQKVRENLESKDAICGIYVNDELEIVIARGKSSVYPDDVSYLMVNQDGVNVTLPDGTEVTYWNPNIAIACKKLAFFADIPTVRILDLVDDRTRILEICGAFFDKSNYDLYPRK